jgi:hypothetical protein
VLRIHQAEDGRLWTGDDRRVAVDSGKDLEEFVAGETLQKYSRVRLLGTPGNAALVERLHTLRKKAGLPEGHSIQIGSPAICREPEEPAAALRAMWHSTVTQGVGGRWVELEDKDYSTYALVAELKRNGWEPNDKVRQILRYHPAWPALSFILGLDIRAASILIGKIIDPRWFAHSSRPNRTSKLYQYLGLTPKNAEHLIFEIGEPGRNFEHCKLVFSVWSKTWSEPDLAVPHRFLHRILRSSETAVRGFLCANKKFIRFVKEVWLHELSANRKLFDPELFFRQREEAAAYETHRSRLLKRRNFG